MKKKSISLIISILILLESTLFIGCTSFQGRSKSRGYNLIVINNSKEGINSFGYKERNSSGGAAYADNSSIKSGDNMKFLMNSNEFSLSVNDKNNNTFYSQKFNVDFNDKTKIYKVSVEKNEADKWEFKLIE